jgi:hypothetical protein
MFTLGHHLVLRLGDDRVIAPSPALRRLWARRLAALSAELPILAWKVVDTHIHILVLGDSEQARELVRRLRIWLARTLQLGVPLELQRMKPLADRSHMEAAFHYVLRQDDHHGVPVDPAQESSALADILGLRVLCPQLQDRVREHLPRTRREALLRLLGVDRLEEAVEATVLLESAKAAFALDSIVGLDEYGRRARRAALVAGRPLGPARLARMLEVEEATASRLSRVEVPPADLRAVRLQMGLRLALRAKESLAPSMTEA